MKDSPWPWIAIAAPGFAIGFPITKQLFDTGLSVWQIMVPRFIVATLVVWAVMAIGRRPLEYAWRPGMILGITNMAIPSVLMGAGTDLLPASVAGILTAFIPLSTVAAAHWMVRGERFTSDRIPGAVLATAGVIVLVVGGESGGGRLSLLGVAVFLTGVGFAGIGGAMNRRFSLVTGVSGLIVPQYVGALIVLAVVGVPLGGADVGAFTTEQVLLVLALGVVSTAIPFVAILKAFQMASASRASLVGYLVPLLAAVASIVLLDESVTVSFVVGGLLIVLGVLMADRLERRPRIASPI